MATSRTKGRAFLTFAVNSLICGCSAAGSGRSLFEVEADSAPTVTSTNPANTRGQAPTPSLEVTPPISGGIEGEGSCAPASVALEPRSQPVDVIIAVDNSASMEDEARAVEASLNVNFAAILNQSQVDYRVILVSEHRERSLQDTAICILEPLSALAECPSEQPAPSERFFQYSTEVGSSNSFEVLLESFNGERQDDFDLAPSGWSEWLRPEADKVFIEITDDDENTTAIEFASALTNVGPEQFGADPSQLGFVWHSIVGLAERAIATDPYVPSDPIEDRECEGDVSNAGTTYQELSRLTGGLRFPICALETYGAVFERVANDLVRSSQSACDFAIPAPPPGRALALDELAVGYRPSAGGEARWFGQVKDPLDCRPDAFLLDATGVHLCAAACDEVRANAQANVEGVFTCQSTLLP
jgi:hypothetical protein